MTGREAIDALLKREEKPKRLPQPRYQKPQAIKVFEIEYQEWYYSGRNIPEKVQVLTKFRDDRANELTKLVVAFIRVSGGFSTRLNSTGIYRNDISKFVPNTQRKGMADIVATYKGLSLNIEVKIGRDRMSAHQKSIRKEIECAGGYYFIARDFEGFKKWFEELNMKIGAVR